MVELAERMNLELVVRIEVVITSGVMSSKNFVSRNQGPPAGAKELVFLVVDIFHLTQRSKINVCHVYTLIYS